MPIASMTGFARCESAHSGSNWVWEIKSVNGRGFDVRFRLPPGFDALENHFRKMLNSAFARGNFNVSLTYNQELTSGHFRLNQAVLGELSNVFDEISKSINCDKPRADQIVRMDGVLERVDAGAASLDGSVNENLVASFNDCIDQFRTVRLQEGEALATAIAGHLARIDALTKQARETEEATPAAIKDRIDAQMRELIKEDLAPEKLAEETALLAVKADVREEIDRLDAHVVAAEKLIKNGGPIGRKLEFLTQEFNREANTLCAKTPSLALKRIGLDLKSVIDHLREQALNVE